MSGLLRRLTRRRPATADETGSTTPESSEPAGAPAETPAEPGGGSSLPAQGGPAPADSPRDEQATHVLPPTGEQPPAGAVDQPTVAAAQPTVAIQHPAPLRDLPAGVDPGELAATPIASARRGKLRRRLRYLRAVRDLLLRDLGGFTYEIQRTAGGSAQEAQRRLIEAKTNRLAALDDEVRGLESRLGEPHGDALLREPGIGGTCPECGELHASDAHYCSRCGAPLDAKARARRDAAVAAAVQQTTASDPTAEPAAASVLWAAGPRPDRTTEPEEEEPHPSAATSQWLALRPHAPVADTDEPTAHPPGESEAKTREAEIPETPASKGDEPAGPATAETVSAGGAEPAATAADETASPGGDEPAASDDESAAAAKPKRSRPSRAKKPAAASEDRPAASDNPATTDGEDEVAARGDDQPAAAARDNEVAARGDDQPAAAAGDNEVAAHGDDQPAAARGDNPAAAPAREDDVAAPGDDQTVAPGDDDTAPVEPKPKRTRAKKPAAPEFEPAPNGRRDEEVPPPPVSSRDPLTSRPEQGS